MTKISKVPINAMTNNKIFELILMPTEQCNFRCSYCYEDFTIGRMRQEIIDGVKNLILNRVKDLNILKISWFGGEPLSAKSVVYDIASYVKKLESQYQFKIQSSMTTNGYNLSATVMEKLLSLNITSFQISLDGTAEYHDKSRLRINKSGSFDKIWQNLVILSKTELNFKIILRIHLTRDNLESIPNLIDKLNQQFKHDKRFWIFFKAIENLGGEGVKDIGILHKSQQDEMIEQFQKMLELQCVELNATQNSSICYASYLNSLVVRADGRIAKCTVALSDDRNAVGYLSQDGHIVFDKSKFSIWVQGIFNQDVDYMTCPYSKIVKNNNDKQTSNSISD